MSIYKSHSVKDFGLRENKRTIPAETGMVRDFAPIRFSPLTKEKLFELHPPCHPQVKHRCLYNGGCRLYGDGIAAGLHRFTLLYEIFF